MTNAWVDCECTCMYTYRIPLTWHGDISINYAGVLACQVFSDTKKCLHECFIQNHFQPSMFICYHCLAYSINPDNPAICQKKNDPMRTSRLLWLTSLNLEYGWLVAGEKPRIRNGHCCRVENNTIPIFTETKGLLRIKMTSEEHVVGVVVWCRDKDR